MEKDGRQKPSGYWNLQRVQEEALKYKTRTEFNNQSLGAYSYAHRNGLLNKVCSHMIKPTVEHSRKPPLTEAEVFEIAKKYNRRVDFQKNDSRAWNFAARNKIKDKICAHMKSREESASEALTYWTLEKVIEKAKECKKWTVFSKKYPNLTALINDREWKEEVLKYLKYDGRMNWHSFSDEQLIEIIKKYKTKDEFQKHESALFLHLNSFKKTHLLRQHLIYSRPPRIKWTKKLVIEKSLKYNNLTDFHKNEGQAYYWACKFKMINTPPLKHLIQRAHVTKWTKEAITLEAKKYTYRKEFCNKSESAYNAARKLKIMDEVCQHMEWRGPIEITKKMVLTKAKEFERRVDFANNAQMYYKRAMDGKYLDEACKHMLSFKESISQTNTKWTEKTLANEALKYKNKADFRKKSSGAYSAACDLKIIKKICKHMIPKDKKWNYEKCKIEALKYKNKIEFNKHAGGCLRLIYQKGWTNLLSHMPTFEEQTTIFTKEKIIEISKKYDDISIFRMENTGLYRKAKILGILKEITKHMKKNVCTIELEVIHPKIKNIIIENNLDFLYHPRKIFNKNIPDFIILHKNKVIIIEAKTEARITNFYSKEISEQSKKQIIEVGSFYKKHEIIHILLSEYGHIQSKYSNYNLSINSFKEYLKKIKENKKFTLKQKPKISLNQRVKIMKKIRKEYAKTS